MNCNFIETLNSNSKNDNNHTYYINNIHRLLFDNIIDTCIAFQWQLKLYFSNYRNRYELILLEISDMNFFVNKMKTMTSIV